MVILPGLKEGVLHSMARARRPAVSLLKVDVGVVQDRVIEPHGGLSRMKGGHDASPRLHQEVNPFHSADLDLRT